MPDPNSIHSGVQPTTRKSSESQSARSYTPEWAAVIPPAKTDVLIIGAGPTGMALAIALQQAGVDYVIIDKLQEGLNTSRAGVIHAHTLDMLDELGITQQLVERGLKITDFCIRDRDKALLRLRFDALPSSHNYVLMLPQDVTETVLSDRLTTLGGRIYRGVTATAIEQNATDATVKMVTPSGDAFIRARYVVGGDGMHSIVRAVAGVEFDGAMYEDSFVLADVRMDWSLEHEVSLFFSPSGLVVVAPLPNGRFRIVATVDSAPEQPGMDFIQELIDSRGPGASKNTVKELLWSSRFRIHHRVARTYRNGRLLLMGDAAHVHSPAGGQGMNTGIVDAVVLGKLLIEAIQSASPEAVLVRYEQMRRPAAERVLALAGRLTSLATMRGTVKLALRNVLLRIIGHLAPVRRRLLLELSGLGRKQLALVPNGASPRVSEDDRIRSHDSDPGTSSGHPNLAL